MPVLRNSVALDRRRFLQGAAASGLAAVAPPAAAETAAALPPSAWDELARALTGGRLVRSGDPDYLKLSRPANLAYQTPLPAGIARCVSRENVQAAIKWCRKFGVSPTARSGGHSYAGFSITDGLMIDVRGIDWASHDTKTRQIRIGGGVLNGRLYQLLGNTDTAITHGRCPTVGAAGFLLGGGIGFNMRAHGVAVDQLEETELVTADGEIVTASHRQNPELLWACRGGGGGNFGINTAFVLRGYPVQPVVLFKLQWAFNGPDPLAVASALMDRFSDAPDGLGSRISLQARRPGGAPDQTSIDLIGQFRGSEATLMHLLQPAFALGPRKSQRIETLPYWDAQKALEEGGDAGERFHERSTFVTRPLDATALRIAYRYLHTWPGTSQPDGQADLRLFQTGGAMNRPQEPTAFVHRDSKWLMVVGLNWGENDSPQRIEENVAWQNAFYAEMLPFSTHGAYQNFIDPAEYDWAHAYYGSALKSLRKVKRDFDPTNVFHFPQSIRLA